MEVNNGTVRGRSNLQTTHEEADFIIPHQVIHLVIHVEKTQITVLADDIVVFVLLLYAYHESSLTFELVMCGKNLSRSSANIKATIENHINILQDTLSAHCLTKTNFIATYYGFSHETNMTTLRNKF